MDELERQQELLARTMEELEKTGSISARTFDDINKSTSKFKKTVEDAEDALDRFRRSGVGKATQAAGDLAKGFISSGLAARENRESFESLNPAIQGVASALRAIPVIGDALGSALEGVGTFVTAEMQRNIESFNTLGQVGALSATGVRGMRESAIDAGLSLAQFSNVIQENSKALAFSTGSTLRGADILAGLAQEAGDSGLRRQFRALGISLEQQNEFFADYLEFNTLLGAQQNRSVKEQTLAARDYILELDELARLTGLSRKEAQAELEQQRANARFLSAQRRAVARFGPEIGETIAKDMEKALLIIAERGSPELAAGIRDLFGGPNTEAAKSALATLGPGALEAANALQTNQISVDEFVRTITENASRFQNRFGEVLPLISDTGTVFDPLIVGTARLSETVGLTADQITRLRETQRDLMGTEEEQTKGLISAADSLQNFAIEMDAFVAENVMPRATDLVGKFADSLSKVTGVINDLTGVQGMASGGPITAGKPYLVGEVGPELIVPGQSGTVIPNNQLFAQNTEVVQPRIDFSNIQNQVGQLNTELSTISAPDLSAMQNQVSQLNTGMSAIAATDVESKLATIRQGLADVPSFVEGFKRAFLPGIGEVAEYAAGNMSTMMIKTLDGQIEEYARYNVPTSDMTVEAYRAGGQTFAQGSYQFGDYQAQTGFTQVGGPRTMYESMMADINPAADANLGVRDQSPVETQSAGLGDNRELVQLMQTLNDNMQQVVTNTRTGADTSKKLLRASTG